MWPVDSEAGNDEVRKHLLASCVRKGASLKQPFSCGWRRSSIIEPSPSAVFPVLSKCMAVLTSGIVKGAFREVAVGKNGLACGLRDDRGV